MAPATSLFAQPAQSIALPLAALAWWWAYHRRTRTLAAQGRPVPRWRRICFAAGLIVLVAALSGPVATLSDRLFSIHMVEHLLVGDVAALLLVLGLTGPLLAPVLRIRTLDRLRVLGHPLVAVPLWALDLYLWHLPALYQGALRHELVHALEHGLFLGLGIALWMPLVGPLPKPAWFGNLGRLLYIVAVRLIGTVLGNVFLWTGKVVYPYYAHKTRLLGLSPQADQSLAGAVMMVEESLLTIGLFAWLFVRSAREGDERQELLDYAAANDMELTEERAARAVAAGRGEELRRRLASAGRRTPT